MTFRSQNAPPLVDDVTGRLGYKNPVTGLDIAVLDPSSPVAATVITGVLPVVNGGTGVATSTGTGSSVLSNGPTLVAPVLGAAAGTSLALTDNSTTQSNFAVTNIGANGAALKLLGNGGNSPSKTIRVNGGLLQVINDAYSAIICQITDGGRVTIGGSADDGLNFLQSLGNVAVKALGSGLRVTEGANGKQGSAVLVAGTVTVSTNNVTANSRIILTGQLDGGTPGFLRVSSRVVGTSFTVTSGSATDTSTIAYQMYEPA